jgi:hypothetical protein
VPTDGVETSIMSMANVFDVVTGTTATGFDGLAQLTPAVTVMPMTVVADTQSKAPSSTDESSKASTVWPVQPAAQRNDGRLMGQQLSLEVLDVPDRLVSAAMPLKEAGWDGYLGVAQTAAGAELTAKALAAMVQTVTASNVHTIAQLIGKHSDTFSAGAFARALMASTVAFSTAYVVENLSGDDRESVQQHPPLKEFGSLAASIDALSRLLASVATLTKNGLCYVRAVLTVLENACTAVVRNSLVHPLCRILGAVSGAGSGRFEVEYDLRLGAAEVAETSRASLSVEEIEVHNSSHNPLAVSDTENCTAAAESVPDIIPSIPSIPSSSSSSDARKAELFDLFGFADEDEDEDEDDSSSVESSTEGGAPSADVPESIPMRPPAGDEELANSSTEWGLAVDESNDAAVAESGRSESHEANAAKDAIMADPATHAWRFYLAEAGQTYLLLSAGLRLVSGSL